MLAVQTTNKSVFLTVLNAQNLACENGSTGGSGAWVCAFCGCTIDIWGNCCCASDGSGDYYDPDYYNTNHDDICYCSAGCGRIVSCDGSKICPVCGELLDSSTPDGNGDNSDNDTTTDDYSTYWNNWLWQLTNWINWNYITSTDPSWTEGEGTGSTNPPPPPPTGITASQAATRILADARITLAERHANNHDPVDNATAQQNLLDVKNGSFAKRSSYTDNGIKGPGGETPLNISLLNGIEYLATRFTISISEIAGGVHSGQGHYNGNAMDVNNVNGDHVGTDVMSDAKIIAFRNACYAAGATKVLDPLNEPVHHFNHFHVEW